jgi:hypothetical protein
VDLSISSVIEGTAIDAEENQGNLLAQVTIKKCLENS